jgi:ATP-dependent RNA helicase RhlE
MYSNNSRFSRPRSGSSRSSGGSASFGGTRYGGGRSNGRKGLKQNIHHSKFIKAAKPVEAEQYVPTNTFSDFNLHVLLKKNIDEKGYVTPSSIQDQAIPPALEGKDIVGIANTGTGKTAAFALPMLNIMLNDKSKRAIVIAPTRELAEQIEQECRSFAKASGLSGALLIGGAAMGPQLRDLRDQPNVVIGTPGRIKDHVERGSLNLSQFSIVVLDEVDRMLDMGFINDIRFILSETNDDRQCLFFSATLDPKIQQLIGSFLTNPVTISVRTSENSDNVHQDVVFYNHSSEKLDKLHDVLITAGVEKAIIFDETKRGVEKLGMELQSRGFKVDALHGDKSQGQRAKALRRFKSNEINFLVATDVAARGIDVVDITHVINYSTPNTYDDYTHRIGRAGRAGRVGYALTFVNK